MLTIQTDTAQLPISAERLFGFLSDLSKHRAFLEPDAQGFEGDSDRHSYEVELMGMKLPQELIVKERIAPSLVSLIPGVQKLFDHTLRFEIAPSEGGCTLRLVDEANLPTMIQMMGGEKILREQLNTALSRIRALAEGGHI